MARTVDVAEVIDGQKISPYQGLIAVMAWMTLFLDGIDNQSIAYVATALTAEWQLPRGALGPVFASGVLGVAIGALVIGPLADRLGRKLVTVSTVIYVAALSFLVTQVGTISTLLLPAVPAAGNLNVLTVLRFFTGLGLGAVVPLGVVIANEFAPKRRRGAMVTLMGCGYAMGSASGGVLSSILIPAFGWQAQFYTAGALTLLMAAVLWAALPESIRLLTLQKRGREIASILAKINPSLAFAPDTEFSLREEAREASAGRLRVARLFLENRAAATALIWLCFFMNLLALNYLNNWLPTLTAEAGLAQSEANVAASFLQFGGMAGVITLGFLSDRFGFLPVLGTSFALGGIFIGAIGWTGADFYALSATIFAAGFCNIGTQITLAAFTATQYPTDIRSTGVSWAHGVARIGSIVSVLMAGTLLALHWPLQTMYYLVAIPMFFGCVWIALLANVKRGRQTQAIARAAA
jgi:MFS transporter, AAHS family, 4-hydroxybenzoate transporter